MGGTAVMLSSCVDEHGNPVTGKDFTDPPALYADPVTHQLKTAFDIRQFERRVPLLVGGTCTMTTFNLREYGVSLSPGAPLTYDFPGPTLMLNKASATVPGDRLTIDLTNNLSPSSEACSQNNLSCDCSQSPKPLCCQSCDCVKNPAAQCCSAAVVKPPNCFHGDNTTNLHFHGSHVSPQSPQDYVLLELEPATTQIAEHPAHGVLGDVEKGSFTYNVNPFPWNQPEGTHWYHPHKHGSTAQQLGNGMAGAMIIKGDFDQWLQDYYKSAGGLTEHVMVMEQVHSLNFIQQNPFAAFAPMPLINGKLQPVVKMRAGEIQRWRFISATMEASAQISIDFNGPTNVSGVVVKQIAMDGVRFSDKNYQCQPLLNTTCSSAPGDLNFKLSPGNRADFLVQAPLKPGLYALTYKVFGRVDKQGDRQRELTREGRGKLQPTLEDVNALLAKVAPGGAQVALLAVKVEACPDPACPAMGFPEALPPMPDYLKNIPEQTDGTQDVQFRLVNTAKGNDPGQKPAAPGAAPQFFGIAVKGQGTGGGGGAFQQFNGDCANFTEPLKRTENWTLSQNVNDTVTNNPFHVFHIHVNAFQVVRSGTQTYPDPIWMDSVTLPDAQVTGEGFPTDDASTVKIRQEFHDYTGAYVIHCHFLGHEDRGMMMMVQAVCPQAPGYYGVPDPNGGPDNCAICVTNPEACTKALRTYPCSPPASSEMNMSTSTAHEAHPPRERKKKQ
jgi:FtsP/CotA-like multicopper oxidase with cupredoxin domain